MILLYGATGFTGELIAKTLASRGLPFVLSGRDQSRLEATAERIGIADAIVRPAHVHAPETLKAAMAGCRVVINCAGPFSQLGEPVIRAAIDCGIHYLDVTGEQAWMRDIYERYESAARGADVLVINGLAFEIAIGDWAAALAARNALEGCDTAEEIDEIIVGYALAMPQASRGTKLSALEVLGQPGNVWRIDRWEPIAPAAEMRVVSFPEPFGEREALSFPSGEVVTVPRHTNARFVQAYISVAGDSPIARFANRAAHLLSPALPTLIASPLGAFARARLGATNSEFTERARKATQFAVVAEATAKFRRTRTIVTGFDLYKLTAEIAVNGAAELCTRTDVPAGVLTPAQVFDPMDHLDALDVTVDQV